MSNLVKLLFQRCHHCLQKWNQIALLMEKTDLILIMLGCISYFSISSYISSHVIALTIWIFTKTIWTLPSNAIEVCLEKVRSLLIFRNYLFVHRQHNFVVKICDLLSKERPAKFSKVSENSLSWLHNLLVFHIILLAMDQKIYNFIAKRSLHNSLYLNFLSQTVCLYP